MLVTVGSSVVAEPRGLQDLLRRFLDAQKFLLLILAARV